MGYYSFGNLLPDKDKITKMFELLETRGRDASGFAFLEDKKLRVVKAPIKSSELVKTNEWGNFVLKDKMIFHTRLKTQGEPQNNMNNHPLFTKRGLSIVHNGIIYNDRDIFGKNQKRDAEVDSEAILAILSMKKKNRSLIHRIKNVYKKLDGGFAVAMLDADDSERLVLFRKDNPIDLYYDSAGDIFYFCSEQEIMKEALGITTKSKRGFNLHESNYHSYNMENNHSLILNKDGVESYKKHRTNKNDLLWEEYAYEPIDDIILVECPFCNTTTAYDFSKKHNYCEFCSEEIVEDNVYV